MTNNKGFTLIELLVSITIAGVVMAAAYSTFMAQNTSYKRQEQIVRMQQDLRAALNFMTREIRMARSDPLSIKDGSIAIVSARPSSLHFTLDVSGGDTDDIDNDDDGQINEADEAEYPDGDVDDANEDITYTLYDFQPASPFNTTDIGRNTGGGDQIVAENIDALDFVYLRWVDTDVPPDGRLDTREVIPFDLMGEIPIVDRPTIQEIEVTIVARTDRPDPNFTDNTVYRNLQNAIVLDKSAAPDRYRRRIASSTIKLRN